MMGVSSIQFSSHGAIDLERWTTEPIWEDGFELPPISSRYGTSKSAFLDR